MSHDIEMPDKAIVDRLAAMIREARDLADIVAVRPHLTGAGMWLQQTILGVTQAHEAADDAAIETDAPLIHRARMLGDYIWTAGGIKFFPQDPKAEEVRTEDIAHALAHVCRWTGHVKRFYSVGEHSLHVAEVAVFLAEQRDVSTAQVAAHALLHDAHEAYLPDVARPIAGYLPAGLVAMAAAVQGAVLEALQLQPPTPDIEAVVKEADCYALRMEAEVLFPHEDLDPDEQNCNLRGIDVPQEVRERFPVWDGDEAPTSESIRDQWFTTLSAAIETADRADSCGVARWQEAKAVVETPEYCQVCAVEGPPGAAPEAVPGTGLCVGCLDG